MSTGTGVFVFVFLAVACGILVPGPGIEAAPSAVKARSPNHWTAREFPGTGMFNQDSDELARLSFISLA